MQGTNPKNCHLNLRTASQKTNAIRFYLLYTPSLSHTLRQQILVLSPVRNPLLAIELVNGWIDLQRCNAFET